MEFFDINGHGDKVNIGDRNLVLFKMLLLNLMVLLRKRCGIPFLFLLIGHYSEAQFAFHYHSIPVFENNSELLMPWAGGINSAQYNALDINGDGEKDLVIFDRSANKLTSFIWDGVGYQHSPDSEYIFPEGLTSWLLFRDFNCDGFEDIFADSQQGIAVYQNSGTFPPEWKLITDPLLTFGSQQVNLFFNDSDISAINDIDADGDLDILAFNFSNGKNIEYHQNFSIDNNDDCGLDYRRTTRSYGEIEECDCGELEFNQPCPVDGRQLHIGGKSLTTLDLNDDGALEMLIGEEECQGMVMLPNKGDINTPIFDEFVLAYPDETINEIWFPAAFKVDFDHDGLVDLGVSTNHRTNFEDLIDLRNSSYFYKNVGSQPVPQFQLQKKNFLQNDMIDVGEEAHPALADFDSDGDLDLFIGNRGSFVDNVFTSSIYVYENTGTRGNPTFQFLSNDYLGFASLNYRNIIPQFVDINEDGALDLMLRVTSASEGDAQLVYMINNSSSEFDYDRGQLTVFAELDELRDYPYVVDINQDGSLDLLIGRRIGALEYHENIGTNVTPDFTLTDNSYLGISTSINRINVVPTIADLNNDGQLDLITTDASGELTIYQNFIIKGSNPKRLILNLDDQSGTSTRLGRITWPVVADLHSDGSINALAGTISGGLLSLRDTTNKVQRPIDSSSFSIYPNPLTIGNQLTIESGLSGTIQIFNLSGQIIDQYSLDSIQPLQLINALLPTGVYVIRFTPTNSKVSVSKRLLVI